MLVGVIMLAGVCSGCGEPGPDPFSRTPRGARGAGSAVTLLNYNVQNLFDANDDGGEYREFTSSGGWTFDAYYGRLIRLGRVLTEMVPARPDIIVLEEIENRRVVEDLQKDFLRGPLNVIMTPSSSSVIRVAVLTRLPVQSVRVHRAIGVAVLPGETPRAPVVTWSDREMVEVELTAHSGSFRLIACHWKSQSGGERATEPRRIQAAALVRTLLANGPRVGGAVIVIGDLNEDVHEFDQHGGAWPTALMPENSDDNGRSLVVTSDIDAAGVSRDRVTLFSPWPQSQAPGSYLHAGRWERLDQALLLPATGKLPEITLEVVAHPDLLDSEGTPRRYAARSGSGYSDHLPVMVRADWREMPE